MFGGTIDTPLKPIYFAANNGKITTDNVSPEIMDLSWSDIKKRDNEGRELDTPSVRYSVYFTPSRSLNLESSCALQHYAFLQVAGLEDPSFQAKRPRAYRRN